MDLDLGLIVRGRGVDSAPLHRDRRVSLDELVEDAALCLHAHAERSDVEQNDVLDLTAENTRLNCCPDGDNFIRVYRTVRLQVPLRLRGHGLCRNDGARAGGLQ